MPGFSAHEARLDDLLEQVLDLQSPAREVFLERLRVEEASLHAELLELLALAEQPAAWLESQPRLRHAVWAEMAAQQDASRDIDGRRVGAWRLLREIGRGGMGSVYKVQRDNASFVQTAALKLIRSDFGGRDFATRFAQERQILASLNHPGIAHLLDGGEDATGQPYLVMEYVDGQRIDDYCEQHRPDLDGRLRLFVQIAEAVEHAHLRRTVHRDLKPSNIVVTAEGQVKLLDFGIARVLDANAGEPAATSHTQTRLFTPDYATPEMIRGVAADIPSDLYQLGLLLYELVCTRRAQQPAELTAAALERAICTETPRLPSVVAMHLSASMATSVGGLTPVALSRRLRGDLDVIVMKALRKEPERRYPSARELIDDLDRWQRHEPVRARPETYMYRMRRFVRRHVWAVTAAATLFVLLAAYAITVSVQARAIAAERDRARAEARRADQVKSLVLRLFEGADPERNLGREISARELLDTGWPAIEAEMGEQPDVQSELLATIGETYSQIGYYDQASTLLQRAVDISDAHPELPAASRAAVLRSQGRVLSLKGQYEEADTALQRAEALFREAYGNSDVNIAATIRDRGQLAFQRADYATAETLFRASLAMRRDVLGPVHRDVADSLGRLGMTLRERGEQRAAEPFLRDALAMHRQLLPAGHPHIATDLSDLGALQQGMGHPQEAEALFREALDSMTQSRGEDHPYVATIMNNLARVLKSQQRYDEADALLRRALAIRRKQLGARHPSVAMNLSDLGWVAEAAGNIDGAEVLYREALDLFEPDHPWRSATVFNLGSVLQARGNFAAAEAQYRVALEAQRKQYGPTHTRVATDLRQLGNVLALQGRADEAEASLREALRIFQLQLDADDARIVDTELALADSLRRPEQRQEAKTLLQRVHAARSRAYGADDARTRDALNRLHALPETD